MRKSVKKKANLVMMTLLGMQILNNPWGFATTGLKYLVRAAMTLIVEYDQLQLCNTMTDKRDPVLNVIYLGYQADIEYE